LVTLQDPVLVVNLLRFKIPALKFIVPLLLIEKPAPPMDAVPLHGFVMVPELIMVKAHLGCLLNYWLTLLLCCQQGIFSQLVLIFE